MLIGSYIYIYIYIYIYLYVVRYLFFYAAQNQPTCEIPTCRYCPSANDAKQSCLCSPMSAKSICLWKCAVGEKFGFTTSCCARARRAAPPYARYTMVLMMRMLVRMVIPPFVVGTRVR